MRQYKDVRPYGLEGVRIQNVDELAEISSEAIYRHFDCTLMYAKYVLIMNNSLAPQLEESLLGNFLGTEEVNIHSFWNILLFIRKTISIE